MSSGHRMRHTAFGLVPGRMRVLPRDPSGKRIAPVTFAITALITLAIAVLTVVALVQEDWAKGLMGVLGLATAVIAYASVRNLPRRPG